MADYWIKGPERLNLFTEAMSAAALRLNHGYETCSALECIVLSAAIVDGLLRIGLIMKKQIDEHTSEVDVSLLHQKGDDQIRSERWVVNQAAVRGIIDASLQAELSGLYDCRNKCIHRYIISDINYDFATNLVFRYAQVLDRVNESVHALEEEQFKLGVGIVAAEADTSEKAYTSQMRGWLKEMAVAKDTRLNRDA
jgi:hypothetical protein